MRDSPRSYYTHHLQQISKAAVLYDSMAIRKALLQLRAAPLHYHLGCECGLHVQKPARGKYGVESTSTVLAWSLTYPSGTRAGAISYSARIPTRAGRDRARSGGGTRGGTRARTASHRRPC